MVNKVLLRLVCPIRQLLHKRTTKERPKEGTKYYFFSFTVTSKQNFIGKYHRLMKKLYNQNCL